MIDLRYQLAKETSRANANYIAGEIERHPQMLIELMGCLLGDEVLLAQRAAMVAGDIGRAAPEKLEPWWQELADVGKNPCHPAILRFVTRYFSECNLELPKSLERELADCFLAVVENPTEKIAPAVFGMQFIADRADDYPDHATRLKTVLLDRIPSGSAGFQSRGKKILKQLD